MHSISLPLKRAEIFANNVISNIAQGNYGQVGSIKGDGAVSAFQSYMGIQNEDKTDHLYQLIELDRRQDNRS